MKSLTVKSLAGIISSLVVIIGTAFAVDARYVTTSQLEFSVQQINSTTLSLFISQIEDRLFELEFKIQNGSATVLEKAQHQRLLDKVKELRSQLNRFQP